MKHPRAGWLEVAADLLVVLLVVFILVALAAGWLP